MRALNFAVVDLLQFSGEIHAYDCASDSGDWRLKISLSRGDSGRVLFFSGAAFRSRPGPTTTLADVEDVRGRKAWGAGTLPRCRRSLPGGRTHREKEKEHSPPSL